MENKEGDLDHVSDMYHIDHTHFLKVGIVARGVWAKLKFLLPFFEGFLLVYLLSRLNILNILLFFSSPQKSAPTLTENDLLVVLLASEPSEDLKHVLHQSLSVCSSLPIAIVTWNETKFDFQEAQKIFKHHVTLPARGLSHLDDFLVEFSAKLILNAISTGAHVLKVNF